MLPTLQTLVDQMTTLKFAEKEVYLSSDCLFGFFSPNRLPILLYSFRRFRVGLEDREGKVAALRFSVNFYLSALSYVKPGFPQ